MHFNNCFRSILAILSLTFSLELLGQSDTALQLQINVQVQLPGTDEPILQGKCHLWDTLMQDRQPVQTFDSSITLVLAYDSVYWIRLVYPEFVGKTIQVDTRNASLELLPEKPQRLSINVKLFPTSSGVDENFVVDPIGFLAWQAIPDVPHGPPGFYPEALRSENRRYEVEYQILEIAREQRKAKRKKKKEPEEKEEAVDENPENQ